MEGFFVLDSENCGLAVAELGNVKGEKMVKKTSLGTVVRKRFSDITNSQHRPSILVQDDKPLPVSFLPNDYIEHLRKENAMLTRLLADRNKIIELSGQELQKLRMNLQKLQKQNWHLAQSNSQMLTELNLGKDRLKAMQHELGCKVALLKAKDLLLEEKEKKATCQNSSTEVKCEEAAEETLKTNDDKKACNPSRRRHSRNHFADPAGAQVATKDKADNKRLCLRRQSARFIQPEPTEDLFEIEDAKFQIHQLLDEQMDENIHTLLDSSTTKEEAEAKSFSRFETQQSRRSSVGRPLRRAAEKVQSYKERPLNVKMRRSE
ncbi:PREDICTED: shugoshin-1-like isoform X2 [Nelumbo nucifera]|uniref:Shugoshin-1-like isoform X2 n=1 Tax=Nelumbo nucifera TaxID=4432 RepID=A0A1U7YVA5_NELNU|nr:PREDICTED: shugoshin-1-like isoform X2 [Nelumbo nucifera]